jgi:hypothetical protein
MAEHPEALQAAADRLDRPRHRVPLSETEGPPTTKRILHRSRDRTTFITTRALRTHTPYPPSRNRLSTRRTPTPTTFTIRPYIQLRLTRSSLSTTTLAFVALSKKPHIERLRVYTTTVTSIHPPMAIVVVHADQEGVCNGPVRGYAPPPVSSQIMDHVSLVPFITR